MNQPHLVCRHCGQAYVLPRRTLMFPACPKCGRPSFSLLGLVPRRELGVALMLAGVGCLLAGYLLPALAYVRFGGEAHYSVIGGIVHLARDGYIVLSGLLLVFTVLFPLTKLMLLGFLLLAGHAVSAARRAGLKRWLLLTGRFSMLDVFVVAILVVVARMGEQLRLQVLPGMYLFGLAILLSMVAGECLEPGGEHE